MAPTNDQIREVIGGDIPDQTIERLRAVCGLPSSPCSRPEKPDCPDCGNTLIELFGNGRTYYMGCKRCSNHVKARGRDRALAKWISYANA
jgi:tRNA(Ile2) C34 agmatinyltransferase TiaS